MSKNIFYQNKTQIQMKPRAIKIVRNYGSNEWKIKMSNRNKDRIKPNAIIK